MKPVQHARITFLTGASELLFPELPEGAANYLKPEEYVSSEAFWKKRFFLYQLKSTQYTHLEQLYGKPVGAVRGYTYSNAITDNPLLTIEYTDNDSYNVKMLLSGAFEAILGVDSSTVNAIALAGAQQLIKTTQLPLAALDIFYVCHNNAAGRKLCGQISAIIHALKVEGLIDIESERPQLSG